MKLLVIIYIYIYIYIYIDQSYTQNTLINTMNEVLYKLINKIVKSIRIPVPKNSKIVYSSHYLAQKIALFVIQSLVPHWLAV